MYASSRILNTFKLKHKTHKRKRKDVNYPTTSSYTASHVGTASPGLKEDNNTLAQWNTKSIAVGKKTTGKREGLSAFSFILFCSLFSFTFFVPSSSFIPFYFSLFLPLSFKKPCLLFSCQGISGRIFNEHFPMSQVNLTVGTCLQSCHTKVDN